MTNKVKIVSSSFALETIYLKVNNLQKTLGFFRELGWIGIRSEVNDFDKVSVYLQPAVHNTSIKLCISEHNPYTINAVQFGLRAVNTTYFESLLALNNAGIKTKGFRLDSDNGDVLYDPRKNQFENETLFNFHVENVTYEELRITHLAALENQYGEMNEDDASDSFVPYDGDVYDGVGYSTLRGIIMKVTKIDDYIEAFQQLGFALTDVKSEKGIIISVGVIVNEDAGLKLILQQDSKCIKGDPNKCCTFLVSGSVPSIVSSDGTTETSYIDRLIDLAELKLNKKVLDRNGKVIPNHASYTDLNKFQWMFIEED